MAFPATYENIKQVSLAPSFGCRDAFLTSDSYVFNGFLEKSSEGAYSVKRPGLKLVANVYSGLGLTAPVSPPPTRFGCFGSGLYKGSPTFIVGNSFIVLATPAGSTAPLLTPTTYTLGVLNPPDCMYRAINLVIQGATVLYLNGSATIPIPTSVSLVPSFCELDGTYYVMDSGGVLWASQLLNFNIWPVLNFVQAFSSDAGVCLFKHLNYLLAFSGKELKVYYDAAISPGAPIAQVTSSGGPFGMPNTAATSIQTFNNSTFWLGRSSTPGLCIYSMSGLTVTKISTPEVERVLNENFAKLEWAFLSSGLTTYLPLTYACRSAIVGEAGHTFYILTCPSVPGLVTGVTLVFDLTMQEWLVWNQDNGDGPQELRIAQVAPAVGQDRNLCMDYQNGDIFTFDANTYQDNGRPINFTVQTDLFAWGNQRTKMIPATYVLGDTLNSNLTISWTDDDYNTFNTPQVVSTASTKKQLIRCGSTVQRGWRIVHTDNTPMRLYSLEVEVQPGAL